MIRIHADGSSNPRTHGVSTLYPAWRRGWTSDIYRPSLRAARVVHRNVLRTTGAANRGLVARSDLTGFNWANVPVILVETGFIKHNRGSASEDHQKILKKTLALMTSPQMDAFKVNKERCTDSRQGPV